MKLITALSLLLLFFQSACGPLAYKPGTSAKEVSVDPKKRVEKNLTEGRGFRLSDAMSGNNNTTYSFASSNPLWKATLEIHKDSISKNEKVIIIDDLIATGGTAEAAAKLVEKSGGVVSGFIFVINLFDLNGKKFLKNKGYKCFSLIDFPGH